MATTKYVVQRIEVPDFDPSTPKVVLVLWSNKTVTWERPK